VAGALVDRTAARVQYSTAFSTEPPAAADVK